MLRDTPIACSNNTMAQYELQGSMFCHVADRQQMHFKCTVLCIRCDFEAWVWNNSFMDRLSVKWIYHWYDIGVQSVLELAFHQSSTNPGILFVIIGAFSHTPLKTRCTVHLRIRWLFVLSSNSLCLIRCTIVGFHSQSFQWLDRIV